MNDFEERQIKIKFAGPTAQGVLDPEQLILSATSYQYTVICIPFTVYLGGPKTPKQVITSKRSIGAVAPRGPLGASEAPPERPQGAPEPPRAPPRAPQGPPKMLPGSPGATKDLPTGPTRPLRVFP